LFEGVAMDSAELRRELASIIRENADAIAERLEVEFVREYPGAPANTMKASLVHQWTLGDLETIASCLEGDSLDALTYPIGIVGEAVKDVQNVEVTKLATRIASILFMFKHIAPTVYGSAYPDIARATALVDCFEEFAQRAIAANCDAFVGEMGLKGAISRKWDLTSFMRSDASDETPLTLRGGGDALLSSLAKSEGMAFSVSQLTQREREVLTLVTEGMSNGEIAAKLGIRQNTVKNHVASIFEKCGVSSRIELIAKTAKA